MQRMILGFHISPTLALSKEFIDKFTILITKKGGHNGFHSIYGCWSDEAVKNWFMSI